LTSLPPDLLFCAIGIAWVVGPSWSMNHLTPHLPVTDRGRLAAARSSGAVPALGVVVACSVWPSRGGPGSPRFERLWTDALMLLGWSAFALMLPALPQAWAALRRGDGRRSGAGAGHTHVRPGHRGERASLALIRAALGVLLLIGFAP
jgi:hypothetical protein